MSQIAAMKITTGSIIQRTKVIRHFNSEAKCSHITGAKQVGFVEIDMTSLRSSGQLRPEPVPGKFPCWRIKGTLNIIVSGRNLRYEVKFPGDIGKVGQSSIAAAFRPGTD